MQSHNLRMKRMAAHGRIAAVALLSAAALMACDVQQADPSPQSAAEKRPEHSQTLPPGDLQAKEPDSGSERNGVDSSSEQQEM